MKKLISLLLCLIMVMSMAACANNGGKDPEPQVKAPASALEILQTVWGKYTDDEKFAAMGGGFSNLVDGAPGEVTGEDLKNLVYSLYIPEDKASAYDSAASLTHMMNANTFTCGVLHLTSGNDVSAFATTMRDSIQNTQWMCGFPDQLLIVTFAGDYVLIAFGNGELMQTFTSKLTASYPDATVAYNEAIA